MKKLHLRFLGRVSTPVVFREIVVFVLMSVAFKRATGFGISLHIAITSLLYLFSTISSVVRATTLLLSQTLWGAAHPSNHHDYR